MMMQQTTAPAPLRPVSAPFGAAVPPPEGAGGATAARGFRAAGIHAGFRKEPGRLDLALVVADEPCACAAVFTKNVFCSAPVAVSREQLDKGAAPSSGFCSDDLVNGNLHQSQGNLRIRASGRKNIVQHL